MRSMDRKIIGGLISGVGLLLFMARALRGKEVNGRHYRVDARRSAAFSLVCFAADIWAIPAILRAKPAITAQELNAADPARVPFYNRAALRQDFSKRDHYRKTSDNVLRGIIAICTLMLMKSRDRRTLFLLFTEAQAAAYTYYSYAPVGPAFQDKYRPVVYYKNEPEETRNAGNNRNSRYSGHTGNAAAASFFMAAVYNEYHPQMSVAGKLGVYLLAVLPPALLGYLRMRALKHFPTDVLMAIGIGGAFGMAVPGLHRASGSNTPK